VRSESKKKNFAIFCEIARLMKKGEHRTIGGLKNFFCFERKSMKEKDGLENMVLIMYFLFKNPQRLHVDSAPPAGGRNDIVRPHGRP